MSGGIENAAAREWKTYYVRIEEVRQGKAPNPVVVQGYMEPEPERGLYRGLFTQNDATRAVVIKAGKEKRPLILLHELLTALRAKCEDMRPESTTQRPRRSP